MKVMMLQYFMPQEHILTHTWPMRKVSGSSWRVSSWISFLTWIHITYQISGTKMGRRWFIWVLFKVLYVCIELYLLWYELYANTLKDLGFVINPYDLCAANKIADGKQCTICWYVKNNKVSHINPKVNTMIIESLAKHFGYLVLTRSKITLY